MADAPARASDAPTAARHGGGLVSKGVLQFKFVS